MSPTRPGATVVDMERRKPSVEERCGLPGYFATTLPGLGSLLRQEIAATPNLEPTDEAGHDGRSDIAFFRVRRGGRINLRDLRLAEDLFVVLAHSASGPPRRVADSVVTRNDLERALSVWTRYARPLASSMSYRVIARVVDETRFKRTELRDAVTRSVAVHRPRWRMEDPADLELWVLEYQRARFVAGLRLSDKQMRQHGTGRTTERRGALRPVVAATSVEPADVLALPHDDATFDALVSNLPFGRQFQVEHPARWLVRAMGEMARVTPPGGRVVVLVPPPVPRGLGDLTLAGTYPLRLLGVSTRIWVFDRNAPREDSGPQHRWDAAAAHS